MIVRKLSLFMMMFPCGVGKLRIVLLHPYADLKGDRNRQLNEKGRGAPPQKDLAPKKYGTKAKQQLFVTCAAAMGTRCGNTMTRRHQWCHNMIPYRGSGGPVVRFLSCWVRHLHC